MAGSLQKLKSVIKLSTLVHVLGQLVDTTAADALAPFNARTSAVMVS